MCTVARVVACSINQFAACCGLTEVRFCSNDQTSSRVVRCMERCLLFSVCFIPRVGSDCKPEQKCSFCTRQR